MAASCRIGLYRARRWMGGLRTDKNKTATDSVRAHSHRVTLLRADLTAVHMSVEEKCASYCSYCSSLRHSLRDQTFRLLNCRLGGGDPVDDETNTALRDHIRAAVSHLNRNHSLGPREADHGEDVHHRVRQPADHGDPLRLEDQPPHLLVRLRL